MPNIHTSPLAGVGEAFMQRAALKQQAKRDDYNAKVQAAQLEIQRQELARRAQEDQRQVAQDAAVAKSRAIQDEANTFSVQQAKEQAAREAQARARAAGMVPAELAQHEKISRQVAELHPELEGEVKGMWQIASKLPDAESKALWLNENAPALVAKATDLTDQKSTMAALKALDSGIGPRTVKSAMFETKLQDFQSRMAQMKPQDRDKELSQLRLEGAAIDANALSIANGGAYLRTLLGDGKIKPGSAEEKQALTLIGLYEQDHPDVDIDQVERTITGLKSQKESGGPEQRIKARMSFYTDFMKADPITGEKPSMQEFEAAWSAVSGEQPAQAPGQGGAGGQQQAEARISELVASGMPHAQAVAQAQREFSGEQAPEADPGMKAPTSTATKHLTKPIDTMDKAGLDAFKKQVDELEGKRKLKAKGSANKRGDGLKNR